MFGRVINYFTSVPAECDCDALVETQCDAPAHYDNCRVKLFERNNAHEYRTKYPKSASGCIVLQNAALPRGRDVLYHLALSTDQDLQAMFGDVKFVCMGGTEERMEAFAHYMAEVLRLPAPADNITAASHRYAVYKVGPVLSVSHGIGIPSMTTVLQEIIKLLHHAGAKNPVMFRIGTSGGLGIPKGTVVVSTFGLNGMLQKSYDLPVLGRMTSRPALFDARLAAEVGAASAPGDGFSTVTAGTMAADDFYMGQARTDGPICRHTEQDKQRFLGALRDRGVRNIEMEATAFAAVTRELGVRAADVCVTLIDRLEGDQVTTPKEVSLSYQKRPMVIVGRFIKRSLEFQQNNQLKKS